MNQPERCHRDRTPLAWNLRWLICVMPLLLTSVANAQEKAAAPGSTTVVSSSRSMVFEATITVVFAGAALYAVCRSSRRN